LIRVLCGQTWFLAEESIQRKNKPLSLLSELLRSADYPTLARSAYERFSQPVVCGHSEQVSLIQTTLRQAAHNGDRFDKVFEQKERDAISLLLPYIGNCDIGASSFSELTEEDVSYWRSNTTLTRLVRFSSFARTVSATSSDIVSMAVTR